MSQQLTALWSLVLYALGVPLCGMHGSFCVVDPLLSWSDRRGWPLAQLVARPCPVLVAGCRTLEDPALLLAHE